MLQLEYISHLYALLLIPICLIGFFVFRFWQKKTPRKNRSRCYIDETHSYTLDYSNSTETWASYGSNSRNEHRLGKSANGLKKEKVQQKSIDVFIALDVSQSMLAKDVSPNRLERAKQFCFKLIKVFKTDRIGIILFAGSAYLQMPLTTDYAAAQTFIKSANTEMVSEQGTNISKAIAMAEKSFEKNNQQHKALIILSDGENHEGAAIDAAENAAKKGMLIFTVGVGEETSVPIPLPYSHSSAYLEDKNGKMVRTSFQ